MRNFFVCKCRKEPYVCLGPKSLDMQIIRQKNLNIDFDSPTHHYVFSSYLLIRFTGLMENS